jgi:hypothetical protein
MSNNNKLAYMRHAPTGSFDGASAQLMAVNGSDEIERRGWWQSMGLWSSGGAPGGGWRGREAVELVQGHPRPLARVGSSSCAAHGG